MSGEIVCDICGRRVPEDSVQEIPDGEGFYYTRDIVYCTACWEAETAVCGCCNTSYPKDEMFRHGGVYFCDDCAKESGFEPIS